MGFKDIRRAFVFKGGIIHLQEKGDTRDCKQWCEDTFGWDEQRWAAAMRGYMTIARIVFFTGKDYFPESRITEKQVAEARQVHLAVYGHDVEDRIYNGVVPGVPSAMWDIILEYSPVRGWHSPNNASKGYFVEEIAEIFDKCTSQEIADGYPGSVLEGMLYNLKGAQPTDPMDKHSIISAIEHCLKEQK